jgi:uncharacterized protein DUF87
VKLFPKDQVVGIFHGFAEGGLEFRADLVLPYKSEFQSLPMHGQFLLVQLEHDQEAILGRITSISASGRLSSEAGEDYGIRAVSSDRPIPEDLREQYLRYQVHIRVLGLVRVVDDHIQFAASHRRLPHVGSRVAFLAPDVLREVAAHNVPGADIGWLAFGEFVYGAGDARLKREPWMQVLEPLVIPKWDVQILVSRRTFVFARAGFGKSNLVKLLFANLYAAADPPTIEKRGGRKVPVGTVIFDPDGEYFWPDDAGRPGLCDVPGLRDRIAVFTDKDPPSPFYGAFVAGGVKLDIRRLHAADVVSIALSPERQEQQNVRKLRNLSDARWRQVVDEIHRNGNQADEALLSQLLDLRPDQEAELYAARANMTAIVRMLHSPASLTLERLVRALGEGKLCVFDVSQARGETALQLSGLILKHIFDHNLAEFTRANPKSIPTIAVVEEAQTVLNERAASAEGVYVSWVKEGRKLDLGTVLVTQQPGSIARQILSQGDNWFIFHLLSEGDLENVRRANSHFSDDILSSLLNEPIPGHGVFWSSAGKTPYPLSIRVLSFEDTYERQDADGKAPAPVTWASRLRAEFDEVEHEAERFIAAEPTEAQVEATPAPPAEEAGTAEAEHPPVDMIRYYTQKAVAALKQDTALLASLGGKGQPWAGVREAIALTLPTVMEGREKTQMAYTLVAPVLSIVLGKQDVGWHVERRPSRKGDGMTTWVVAGPAPSPPG